MIYHQYNTTESEVQNRKVFELVFELVRNGVEYPDDQGSFLPFHKYDPACRIY
jgi:hypothetical protein